MLNVKLFIDFWNFQNSFNDHVQNSNGGRLKINWEQLPNILIDSLQQKTVFGGQELLYKGVEVYASVDLRPQADGSPSRDKGLQTFLTSRLGQLPGYHVSVLERRPTDKRCPHCGKQTSRSTEKGVDTSIVTALFNGAINKHYDYALLLSNDSDFAPAVGAIQDRFEQKIIHVGFRRGGDRMRTAAWAHLVLDGPIAEQLSGAPVESQPQVAPGPSRG